MSEIRFRVRLICDAQPATGLGGGETNSLVPRDANRRPYLPGSHVKGLMRASLKEIALQRADWKSNFERKTSVDRQNAWPYPFLDFVFGTSDSASASYESKVRVDDATLVVEGRSDADATTHFVARTGLGADGLAKASSLRTTETLSAETQFEGTIYSPHGAGSLVCQAWSLALVAISAIGGSRSRSGQCVVDLIDEQGNITTPSIDVMLTRLTQEIADWTGDEPSIHRRSNTLGSIKSFSEKSAVIELLFAA
jgi:CRISPR/Cas system CSM-associated protein Csm3 (group 7 of RAMP superfamily)